MRETPGLVDALVSYIKDALENNKAEDKVRLIDKGTADLIDCFLLI